MIITWTTKDIIYGTQGTRKPEGSYVLWPFANETLEGHVIPYIREYGAPATVVAEVRNAIDQSITAWNLASAFTREGWSIPVGVSISGSSRDVRRRFVEHAAKNGRVIFIPESLRESERRILTQWELLVEIRDIIEKIGSHGRWGLLAHKPGNALEYIYNLPGRWDLLP
jgi:hypothetical protein